MEYAIGKQAIQSGAEALNNELSKVNYRAVRKYFDINDSYILSKLLLLVVPFYYKEDQFTNTLYRPEMYLPSISIITLVLLRGFLLGIAGKFHPEVLGMIFTRKIVIHTVVSLGYKAMCYFLDVRIDLLDIFCYTGYKFLIILIVKIVKSVILGRLLSVYFFVAYFFFLSRSLKRSIIAPDSPKKHIYLLFLMVGVDILITFLMS